MAYEIRIEGYVVFYVCCYQQIGFFILKYFANNSKGTIHMERLSLLLYLILFVYDNNV